MALWVLSPPGLGTLDWALLGLSLAFVAGLPIITRLALRRGGPSARALVVIGVGFGLLMAMPMILTTAAWAQTGLWPIVFAGLMVSGAGLAIGANSLIGDGQRLR